MNLQKERKYRKKTLWNARCNCSWSCGSCSMFWVWLFGKDGFFPTVNWLFCLYCNNASSLIRQGSDQEFVGLGNPVRPKPAVIWVVMDLKVVWPFCLETDKNIDLFYSVWNTSRSLETFIRKDKSWSNSKFIRQGTLSVQGDYKIQGNLYGCKSWEVHHSLVTKLWHCTEAIQNVSLEYH